MHLISIDPLDENYFATAGPSTENVVSVWDKRRFSSMSTAASPDIINPALLDIRPVLPGTSHPNIWSLRYNGYQRGTFAALSGTGLIRLFETQRTPIEDRRYETEYVRHSHNIQSGSLRPIAFDHVPRRCLSRHGAILALTADRQLQKLDVPSGPPKVCISSTADVVLSAGKLVATSSITRKSLLADHVSGEVNERTQITGDSMGLSSRDRHERFIRTRLVATGSNLGHVLRTIDLQRQRCLEGYLFDCDKNMSLASVKDDPWLVELWDTAKRLKQMASNRGMMHGGLDMSYYGVYDIWFANFEGRSHRMKRKRVMPSQEDFSRVIEQIIASQSYGVFDGIKTKFPERRQISLGICGWKFDERRLREKCSAIISRKEYYKAIIVAVIHGRKDLAIDMLKSLTRTKELSSSSSALAAVVACNTVSEEQRELCSWMAEEAEDPYLKALLAYFVSGTWQSVSSSAGCR